MKNPVIDLRDTRLKVREFIENNFSRTTGGAKFGDDASFLENEIIDSTGVLELVLFLEETFGIKVEDDEIVPENLDSIDNVLSYLTIKTRISKR